MADYLAYSLDDGASHNLKQHAQVRWAVDITILVIFPYKLMTTFHLTPKSIDLEDFLHIHDFHSMTFIISPPIFRDLSSTHTPMKWIHILMFFMRSHKHWGKTWLDKEA